MRFRQVDNVTRNASELDELLANETYLVKVFAWNGIGRLADGWVGGSWSRERRKKIEGGISLKALAKTSKTEPPFPLAVGQKETKLQNKAVRK